MTAHHWRIQFVDSVPCALDLNVSVLSAADGGRGGQEEGPLGRGGRKAPATSFQHYLKGSAGQQILHHAASARLRRATDHAQRQRAEKGRRAARQQEESRRQSRKEGGRHTQ